MRRREFMAGIAASSMLPAAVASQGKLIAIIFNLKAANLLGLQLPAMLLARADELIE
jgi:hypothetical protein